MKIKETRPVEVVAEVICDCCGESCTKNREDSVHEFATLSADWGYHSNHDNESYRYQLCENCFFGVLAHLRERSRTLGVFDDAPADPDSPLARLRGSVSRFDRPTEPMWPVDDDDTGGDSEDIGDLQHRLEEELSHAKSAVEVASKSVEALSRQLEEIKEERPDQKEND